ncbi:MULTISPECIES: DeoR/GlpR family DNA-binding transcription regulator [unclassified Paenibacillus]|uniref:DeoR/GlpR family DNA-binding transcription regulator n=1 Tax=unclassified Paenibacillus TaxID=185978 RepID=UPI00095547B6|nr:MULTISPECIES: DeoR/GlpR family DNA-binding transcription regulator [unclassified Paenibacillus]ASS65457.1 DeoR/GlpR transcriptional regulator [Paenibacillus sp. RUD330]SIQ35591.1 transcriptional regulator, DeoR family [Paenibacillus sp. RU4X]SIQ57510.1 transcriptional regulator, DeoR family [Paenibacillus sp. RU4T]
MLVAERYEKIIGLINENGSMRVSELSRLCEVTEETIRRDLARLEAAGQLRRSHGGAVSLKNQNLQPEIPYALREVAHAAEKRRIAEEAIKLILPRDRIFLDASTTAWYMASMLPDMEMTVLTNSVKVTMELASKEQIRVITAGGMLTQSSLSFVGPLTERSLESYYVDKLFFSCRGIHPERGISESNELQARIKAMMVERAGQAYLLADSSKFGVQAFTHVAAIGDVSMIVADDGLGEDMAESLRKQNIPLTLVGMEE